MAIILITGEPGAGKSYSAVYDHVIPALSEGRRVVTNLAGINDAKLSEFTGGNGELVKINNDDILRLCREDGILPGDYFYDPDSDDLPCPTHEAKIAECQRLWPVIKNGVIVSEIPSIIRGGDVILLDECALLFPPRGTVGAKQGKSLQESAREYCAMHRHYPDAEGRTGNIIFLAQATTMLPVELRPVVSRHILCTKNDYISRSMAGRYTMEVFPGITRSGRGPMQRMWRRYIPAVCECYSSHETGGGGDGAPVVEMAASRGGGFFDSLLVRLMLIVVVPLVIFMCWFLYTSVSSAFGILNAPPAAVLSESPAAAEGVDSPSVSSVAAEAVYVPPVVIDCGFIQVAGDEVKVGCY